VHALLKRLDAEGLVPGGLLGFQPLTRAEALGLVERAAVLAAERRVTGRIPLIIDDLRARLAPRAVDARVGLGVLSADALGQDLEYNAGGEHATDGLSAIAMARLHLEGGGEGYLPPWRMAFEPRVYLHEYAPSDEDVRLDIRRLMAGVRLGGLDVAYGRDGMWWGPGRHGALLLTNNAEPLTSLRLTNARPAELPWIFGALGPTRLAFFVTQLEGERAAPHPWLWGMRLGFRPSPYVEVGLSRVAMLGGGGRRVTAETWLDSVMTFNENIINSPVEPGNQIAGFDVTLTLPFDAQPVQIYLEAEGEDRSDWKVYPSQFGEVVGVYLPRIYGLPRCSLLVELADNHITGSPNGFYSHHAFPDGYTYHGRIIGHHMGTDSRDLYAELALNGVVDGDPASVVRLFADRETHDRSGSVYPERIESGVSVEFAHGAAEVAASLSTAWYSDYPDGRSRAWLGSVVVSWAVGN
jgi:hypothetical protein